MSHIFFESLLLFLTTTTITTTHAFTTRQVTCTDTPGFLDSTNEPCSWYALTLDDDYYVDYYDDGETLCKLYGAAYANPNTLETANTACCVCGGGSTHTQYCEDIELTDPVTGLDTPWTDRLDYGCPWYGLVEVGDDDYVYDDDDTTRCDFHGDADSNQGYTSKTACCVCGGGRDGDVCLEKYDGTWTDALGNGCDWYDYDTVDDVDDLNYEQAYSRCLFYGHLNPDPVFSAVADEVCCICGGGDVELRELDSASPTNVPSDSPSFSPSDVPTVAPSSGPSGAPSNQPTTEAPTPSPSAGPSVIGETPIPSNLKTDSPSVSPIASPVGSPTGSPSVSPIASPVGSSTASPSVSPVTVPTGSPSVSSVDSPTSSPSVSPVAVVVTSAPVITSTTSAPTEVAAVPGTPVAIIATDAPVQSPTTSPTKKPTKSPTKSPTKIPTKTPTSSPSFSPTSSPTSSPSAQPIVSPSADPSSKPTASPTEGPVVTVQVVPSPTMTTTTDSPNAAAEPVSTKSSAAAVNYSGVHGVVSMVVCLLVVVVVV